jgi:hypothetical protein
MDEDTIEGVVQSQIANPRAADPDARTLRTSPPTSPRSRASPGSSRPRRPGGRAARSSPTTAAAPVTPSRQPRAPAP